MVPKIKCHKISDLIKFLENIRDGEGDDKIFDFSNYDKTEFWNQYEAAEIKDLKSLVTYQNNMIYFGGFLHCSDSSTSLIDKGLFIIFQHFIFSCFIFLIRYGCFSNKFIDIASQFQFHFGKSKVSILSGEMFGLLYIFIDSKGIVFWIPSQFQQNSECVVII